MSPTERRSGRAVDDPSSRSEARRDRDRVLYSDPFRRLGGVTQVALGDPDMVLHNRLTHSLKVEQVGRSIYSRLAAENPNLDEVVSEDAVAAACLAHDIGHPPFGHAGEVELHALVVCPDHRDKPRLPEVRKSDPCEACKLEDGFEGNAQSFRVISVLAIHRDSQDSPWGLDLTRSSLQATSKYPWLLGSPGTNPKKWGAYDCDAEILEFAAGTTCSSPTLAAQIMDWADDISYAVHDLEDFYRIGLIPLNDYAEKSEALLTFIAYIKNVSQVGELTSEVLTAFDSLLTYFPTTKFTGSTTELAALDYLRGRFLSQFISPTTVADGELVREPIADKLNKILKQFIWFDVIDEPRLSSIQVGQRLVLREIFETLAPFAIDTYGAGGNATSNPQALRRLPWALTRAIGLGQKQDTHYTLKQIIYRGVLDYISSLSDAEAYRLHSVLKGRESAGRLAH